MSSNPPMISATDRDFARQMEYAGFSPTDRTHIDTINAVRTLLAQAGHETTGPTVFYATARLMLSLRTSNGARADFLRLCGL
jgi:hypothetical protein